MTDTHNRTDGRASLDEMLSIARDGARAGAARPLLGGEIGLMWTAGAAVALGLHGLALLGVLPIPNTMIGLIWLIYGVGGSLLGWWLGRRYAGRPERESVFNRVSESSWTVTGAMFFAVSIAAVVGHVVLGLPYLVYNFIVPFAFGVSAVNNGVVARMTGFGYLKYGAVSAGAVAVICLLMVDRPEMYLVAAVGLLLSGVATSWIEVMRGRAHTGAAYG